MNDECEEETIPHTSSGRPESVMIKLTRMEGKLDNLHDRLSDMRPRVDRHDKEIGDLRLKVQALKQGATASAHTAEALAKALREAKEATEATARADIDKLAHSAREEERRAALGWSPVTKVFAVAAGMLTAIVILQQVMGGVL